jgi:DUF917 family protein
MERVSREIRTKKGSIAATCKAPRTGAEVKRWGIRWTRTKAIRIGAGADRANLRTVETEDMALSYLPGNALRDRGRMVGDVAAR